MRKNAIALVLALALLGTLAACGTDRNSGGSAGGSGSGSTSGAAGKDPAGSGVSGAGSAGSNSSGASAGQVARRHSAGTVYNGRTYWNDGRYAANADGRVYDNSSDLGRDLTRDARDIVRDAGDAIGDVGRDIGSMITGSDGWARTPSWEPDSSAVRY